ncbi:MAG: hypothetical protein CSA32_04505 [Desulfobulbus propionicus]|nr:MAG: hypothetical protein CSA32_04505 [Desulfobulbus propionicus]
MAQLNIEMRVPVCMQQEGDVVIARCPLLEVASQGCSEKEARANLVEALSLFIETCIEMGTLDTVLKQSGFRQVAQKQGADGNIDEVNICLPYATLSSNARECHA